MQQRCELDGDIQLLCLDEGYVGVEAPIVGDSEVLDTKSRWEKFKSHVTQYN